MSYRALWHDLPPLDDTATDEETLTFLLDLVRYQRPKLVVEAGTYHGHFAVGAARLLPDTIVCTADTTEYTTLPALSNLHFVCSDFETLLAGLGTLVDFAFIDSGPPYAGSWEHTVRWRHWQAVKPHLRHGGIALCHDTNSTDWQHATDILAESVRLTGGRGLALYQHA